MAGRGARAALAFALALHPVRARLSSPAGGVRMRGEMLSSGRMIPWSRAAAGIFSVAVVLVSPIHAATIDVTTFEDVVADDGACALREAIGAVNAQAASGALVGECVAGDGNDDTIVLAAGSYYLTIIGAGETGNASGDLDLRANMTIAGNAGAPTTIDASLLSAARSATIRAGCGRWRPRRRRRLRYRRRGTGR